MTVQLINKVKPLFAPFRYKVLYGGRGGLKSWSIAQVLLLMSMQKPIRVLCTREFQNSIKESVFKLLEDQIDKLKLTKYFKITNNEVTNTLGSQFIFTGLHNNVTKIKSMEGIDIVWCEEAETISEYSWSILIPTIRKPGSEIWISFNPLQEDDPTYNRFVTNTPPNTFVQKLSWRDNPWLSQEVLDEKDYLYKNDRDAYDWVWEGEFLKRSQAQVFWDKCHVRPVEVKADWDGPYYGLDWGFSADPMRMVKCYVNEKKLYIKLEVDGIGIDIPQIPKLLLENDSRCKLYQIRADSSRPELISYMRQQGFDKIRACKKGPGSIEAGIAFIRSFEEIVIDPSCIHTIEEAKLYKYKVDKLTGAVLPDTVDKFNHSWDGVRYALEPLMPHKRPGTMTVT